MYWANFRRYWKEQLTHAAVAAVAGLLLVEGYPWAGMGVLALVISRQALEWGNRAFLPILGILVQILAEQKLDLVSNINRLTEWREKRDTPGIDLAYHLAGCLAGIVAGLYLF